MNKQNNLTNLVLTALMMCLVMVGTMFIRIPTPLTQGYVHPGDSMIFLAVLILGKKNGSMAAGIGSALADILGGYAYFAPWTLIVKFLMAFVMGFFIEKVHGRNNEKEFRLTVVDAIGMALGGAVMAFGYFVVETVMYGNAVTAAMEIPANVGQFVTGMVIACVLAAALYKTPARKYFAVK